MPLQPSLEDALRIARVLIDATGMSPADAAANPAIPETLREAVAARLAEESVIQIRDPRMVDDPNLAGPRF